MNQVTHNDDSTVRSHIADVHAEMCDGLGCPCFNQGFEDGYRQKERELRLGLAPVLTPSNASYPTTEEQT